MELACRLVGIHGIWKFGALLVQIVACLLMVMSHQGREMMEAGEPLSIGDEYYGFVKLHLKSSL